MRLSVIQPAVTIPLALAGAWYCAGILRLYRERRLDQALPSGRIAAFAGGIAVLALALLSPLGEMSEALFSAHMSQHLLLLLVAPPLLVCGRPGLAMFWALPARLRKRLGQLWVGSGFARALAPLMHPVPVWLLFSGSFIFWHLSGPYGWAERSAVLHAVEHSSFLISGLMFWTIVIAPAGWRRIGPGVALIFLATTAVFSGLPGAIIFLAPRPLYPLHAGGAAAWGLTLIEDQQLAGVIMWIPGGLIYLAAVLWAFLRWLRESERRSALALRRGALPPMLALAALASLPAAAPSRAQDDALGGNADRGARLIQNYGCGTCHTIPGIDGANGLVGPPLTQIGRRIFLAGLLRNTPENMLQWLQAPQSIVPGNAMPDMDIPDRDARDIAAYLYTLR
jgi:putative membrane protein